MVRGRKACARRAGCSARGFQGRGSVRDQLEDFVLTLGQRLDGLVLKAGAQGVTANTADGRLHVPALPKYPAFDTTGAGDAVAGGMLARWLSTGAQRSGLQDALVCGVACASLTIEAIGVRGIASATPTLLDERMGDVWEFMRRAS